MSPYNEILNSAIQILIESSDKEDFNFRMWLYMDYGFPPLDETTDNCLLLFKLEERLDDSGFAGIKYEDSDFSYFK